MKVEVVTGSPFSEQSVRFVGELALYTFLIGGLLLVLGFAVTDANLLLFVPLVLIVVPVALATLMDWTTGIMVALISAPLVMRVEEGVQLGEALFGLYFVGFLTLWFLRSVLIRRQPFIVSAEDRAVLLFLCVITAWIPLTFLFGGSPRTAFSEWIALVSVGLYFPVKELCATHPKGARLVLGALLWLCLFAAADKILAYSQALQSATAAWQIIENRVTTIEVYLLVPAIFGLIFYLYQRGRRAYASLFLFLLFLGMLIITQSRGYWIDFVVGFAFLFLIVGKHARKRMLILSVTSTALILAVGLAFFSDLFLFVAAGIVDRIVSLGSAFEKDISLINRMRESATVAGHILKNPVIGYGMGVSFHFYDITTEVTRTSSFVHHGILSLWYRFGILGAGAIIFLWYRSVRTGLQLYRDIGSSMLVRMAGLAVAVSLVALIPSVNTSNPFYLLPEVLMFTILFATVSGLMQARAEAPVVTASSDNPQS